MITGCDSSSKKTVLSKLVLATPPAPNPILVSVSRIPATDGPIKPDPKLFYWVPKESVPRWF